LSKETIESRVLEIKDKSELMIDLSYSSLIYDNTIIAKEVYDLEDLVDNIYESITYDLFNEVKNGNISVEYAQALLKLAKVGEEIADAAREIADVQLRDVELHPIVKMSFRESDEVITKVKVSNESILCGKTLGQLKLGSETGMTIIAMRQQNKWLYGPNKRTRIDSEDILFAKGPEDGESHLIELAEGKTQEI